MNKTYHLKPDIEVLPAHVMIPMMGFLPVNSDIIMSNDQSLMNRRDKIAEDRRIVIFIKRATI